MSGVAIVRALLAADPRVLALVPATRVRTGVLPQATELQAVNITQVYSDEFRTVARNNPNKQIRERVQVTVYTKDYAQMKRLLKACSLGPGVHTGMVLGFYVNSILPEGENPEIDPGDDNIYEQSRDFMVTFVEAN